MPSLIERFLTGHYTVKRTCKGTYVNGIYQPGPMEEVQMFGSLQPTNARELKLPEEGNRLKQYYKFYSDQPLLIDSEKNLAGSDRICINGEWFKAMEIDPWQGEGFSIRLPYFMTIVYREPEQYSDGTGGPRQGGGT